MKNHEQTHHTARQREMQVVMPLNIGMRISATEPVRVLMEVSERLDYGKLRGTYQRPTRRDEATAKQLFRLTVLGFMHGQYSTRALECACGSRFEPVAFCALWSRLVG